MDAGSWLHSARELLWYWVALGHCLVAHARPAQSLKPQSSSGSNELSGENFSFQYSTAATALASGPRSA